MANQRHKYNFSLLAGILILLSLIFLTFITGCAKPKPVDIYVRPIKDPTIHVRFKNTDAKCAHWSRTNELTPIMESKARYCVTEDVFLQAVNAYREAQGCNDNGQR